MSRPRIHLIAPAASCRPFLKLDQFGSVTRLMAIVQNAVGPEYEVTGDAALIDADEDERMDGRHDDAERAADIQTALADNRVAAVVAIRGGAWLTRILPRIDFDVLDGRRSPVAMFGFSEITSLVNIVGFYRNGRGVYDNSPGFLPYGLRHFAHTHASEAVLGDKSPRQWSQDRLLPEFEAFFRDTVSMIEGKGTARTLSARLVSGNLATPCEAQFVGGNLTLLAALAASPYRSSLMPKGRWLVIEDYKERPSRIDRMLTTLRFAGFFEQCDGILVGEFHRDYEDTTPAVVALLRHHLPTDRNVPVLVTESVGHIWPSAPLPLHAKTVIEPCLKASLKITFPAAATQTVGFAQNG